MTEPDPIVHRVIEIIHDTVGADVDSTTPLRGNGSPLDSLDVVECIMAIEDDFGINLPDDEHDKFKTVPDIADYIRRNQA